MAGNPIDKVIGIDLGTTNSIAAVMDPTDQMLIFAEHGPAGDREYLLPSVVAFVPEENRNVVGRPARQRRGLLPAPLLSMKRKMGTSLVSKLGAQDVLARDVAAMVLGELRDRMQSTLREKQFPIQTTRAVITVPAQFDLPPSEDTQLAGEQAGLEVVELLSEPIAAAIHYCWTRKRNQRAADRSDEDGEELLFVYDMGGGTIDATVVRRKFQKGRPDDFQTLAVAGDRLRGGDNFDAEIARQIFQQLNASHQWRFDSLFENQPANVERFAKLLAIAEQIKMRLSDGERVDVNRKDLFVDDDGKPVHLQAVFTREQIDGWITDLVLGTMAHCTDALEEANLRKSNIDTVLMIGGSSRYPLVQRTVRRYFCAGADRARCAAPVVHAPTLSVGAGAALKAASLGTIYQGAGPRIAMTGYGSSAESQAIIRFDLPEDSEIDLTGGRGSATNATGAVSHGDVLGGTRIIFDPLPLNENVSNTFLLSVKDQAGLEYADFRCSILHDPEFVKPLGLNTAANVLSYDLSLGVETESGERKQELLAGKLTPLPSKSTDYNFRFPGDTDRLLFQLYGDSRLIKIIPLDVDPSTPKGARIRLNVSIAANQKVRCEGIVDAVPEPLPFAFDVPALPEEEVPTRAEFEDLRRKVDESLPQYRGEDVGALGMRASRAVRELERAFETHDEAAIIQRMHDLHRLADLLDPKKQMVTPPLEEFHKDVRLCQDLSQAIRRSGDTSLDLDEIDDAVRDNSATGDEAAEATPPDQELYSRCWENIQAQKRVLYSEYSRLHPETPEETALARLRQAKRLLDEVAKMSLRGDHIKRLEQAAHEIRVADTAYRQGQWEDASSHATQALFILEDVGREQRNGADEDDKDKNGDDPKGKLPVSTS